MAQDGDEGVGVWRAQADGVGILQPALEKILGAHNGEGHVGLFAAEGGIEDAQKRVAEVLRGDRVAIGPLGVRPQVKRIGEAVGGDVPALGHAGEEGHPVVGPRDEALKQRTQQGAGGAGIVRVRIKIRGLVAVPQVEHLLAVAGFDRGLAPRAAAEQEGDGRGGK